MKFSSLILLLLLPVTAAERAVGHDVSHDLRSGKPVNLECSYEGTSYEQLTWQFKPNTGKTSNIATYSEKHGTTISSQQHKDRVNLSANKTYTQLTLSSVTVSDAGCYICVFNTFGSGKIESKSCLTVYAVPRVTVQTLTVYVCESEAYPASKMSYNSTDLPLETHQNSSSGSHGMTVAKIFTQLPQAHDPQNIKCVSTWNQTDTVIEVYRPPAPRAEAVQSMIHNLEVTQANAHGWAVALSLLSLALLTAITLLIIFCCTRRSRNPSPALPQV